MLNKPSHIQNDIVRMNIAPSRASCKVCVRKEVSYFTPTPNWWRCCPQLSMGVNSCVETELLFD